MSKPFNPKEAPQVNLPPPKLRDLTPIETAMMQLPSYFINWKSEQQPDGRVNKLPCAHNGVVTSIHKNHRSFSEADKSNFPVGLVFTLESKLAFIDLDHCLINGQWSEQANNICKMFPSAYIEISQSDEGLHIIFSYTGELPPFINKNTLLGIELYITDRYCALTGKSVTGNPLADYTASLHALIAQYMQPNNNQPVTTLKPSEWTTTHQPNSNPIQDDNELINKALNTSSAGQAFGSKATFNDLWNANDEALSKYYPPNNNTDKYDRSSADMALATHLMFWTGGNCERVERLMRQSYLMRPKWNTHATYLKQFTIMKAYAGVTTYYNVGGNLPVPMVTVGFEQFSITGQSAKMKLEMAQEKFVLGRLALLGQMLIIFAPPNAGKTLIVLHLIIKAIREGVISGADVIYINADDGYRGLIQKTELAENYNFLMIAPGHNGFQALMLKQMLIQYTESGEAKNKIIILDTIKKFADHMNKKESAEFATIVRAFVSKGGTVIALSHVNKRRGADGSLIHAGTSDFKDDFDTVYMLDVIEQDITFKTVSFINEKSRGDNVKQASYKYLNRESADYFTILESVKELNDSDIKRASERARLNDNYKNDEPVINSLIYHMKAGVNGKVLLVKKVHDQTGESKRTIEKVLKRYEGDDSSVGYKWKLDINNLEHNTYNYTPLS